MRKRNDLRHTLGFLGPGIRQAFPRIWRQVVHWTLEGELECSNMLKHKKLPSMLFSNAYYQFTKRTMKNKWHKNIQKCFYMSRHGFTSVQLTRINLPPQQLQRVPPDECWKLTWKKPKWWDMRDETACNTRHVKWRDMSTLLLHLLQGLLRDVLRSHILTILNSEHIYILST